MPDKQPCSSRHAEADWAACGLPACRHHWEADYEDLLNLRHSLSQLGQDQAELLLYVLDMLQHLPLTTLLLQQTQIGASVKALRQVRPCLC